MAQTFDLQLLQAQNIHEAEHTQTRQEILKFG